MENRILRPWIDCFQTKDREAFLSVYGVFEALIGYYAAKLPDEDARQELTVFLLELADGLHTENFSCDSSCSLQRYIAVCIRNRYFYLSEQYRKNRAGQTALFEESGAVTLRLDDRLGMKELLWFLSDRQREILLYRYVYGYSDREISEHLGISRQAVNRLKNRGLSALRERLKGSDGEEKKKNTGQKQPVSAKTCLALE